MAAYGDKGLTTSCDPKLNPWMQSYSSLKTVKGGRYVCTEKGSDQTAEWQAIYYVSLYPSSVSKGTFILVISQLSLI